MANPVKRYSFSALLQLANKFDMDLPRLIAEAVAKTSARYSKVKLAKWEELDAANLVFWRDVADELLTLFTEWVLRPRLPAKCTPVYNDQQQGTEAVPGPPEAAEEGKSCQQE